MPGKLLNPVQAADYLGVFPQTLQHWRAVRKGPKYILMGELEVTDDGPGRRGIRYDTDHLDEFIASRTVEPSKKERPASSLPKPRRLTDEEWTAIETAFVTEKILRPFERYRASIDAMLDAVTAGEWPEGLQHNLRASLESRRWMLVAFNALSAFSDFPYGIAVQYSVVRKGAPKKTQNYPWHALTIRTDLHGPLKHSLAIAIILDTARSSSRSASRN